MNKKFLRSLLTALSLAAVITTSACGSSAENDSETIAPPATYLEAPAEIADALSKDETAEVGVWSLLSALGIGVYTGSGEQLLAGSESDEDDFWLYDFEVPLMAKLAVGDSHPFSDYQQLLSAWGIEKSSEDLVKAYNSVYADNSNAFLVQLFKEMGLEFEGDPEITPLQEWLLMLDTFVPKNEKKPQALSPFIAVANAETICGKLTSELQKSPAWGWAQGVVLSLSEVAGIITDILDPIHAGILQVGVETSLVSSSEASHEKHKSKQHGDYTNPLTFTATAEYVFELGEVAIECGGLAGFDLPPQGPIEGMRIDWTVPSSLAPEHGTMSGPDSNFDITFTRENGETAIDFIPKNEAADGEGTFIQEVVVIEAEFNVQQALGNFFSFNAMAQEVFNRHSEAIVNQVSWHNQGGMVFEWLIHTEGGADYIGSARTCFFPEGPWEGEVEVIGVLDGGSEGTAPINGTGTFEFEFPGEPDVTNKYFVKTTVDTSGEISIKGNPLRYTDPLEMTFTLNDQTQNVRVVGGSTGKGQGVMNTPTGPFSFPVLPSVFPKIETLVPVEPDQSCGS